MTIHLLRLEPNATALAHWATRNRVLSPDGDFGYAFHALFAAAFGDLAPKPFRYLGGRQGLLAYSAAPLNDLQMNAGLATPDIALALGLDTLDARPFPSNWQGGQQLGFEVRVRPVVRTKDGRERDAFLHAVEERPQSDRPVEESSLAGRQTVYASWLASQLEADGAAELVNARMESFALTRVLRRSGQAENGKRRSTHTTGPDVVFKGLLKIGNSEAFNRLLARGLGRHRAFGFGMLLLKPAASC